MEIIFYDGQLDGKHPLEEIEMRRSAEATRRKHGEKPHNAA
jgi:hypothetical protein